MAPKSTAFLALFTILSLVFVVAVHGCEPDCSNPAPPPPVVPTPPGTTTCPINTLNLKVCVDVLEYVLKIRLYVPSSQQCCTLLRGLADLDAALCLCTAVKANVLGVININVPVDITLLNCCHKTCPPGFTCPL